MTLVIGRREGGLDAGPAGRLGAYRALDGSSGADLYLDLDGPHAVLIVGKRGYGKSYTMGVVAEALARVPALAPVVVDPMGAFATLAEGSADGDGDAEVVAAGVVDARVIEKPRISPSALDPRSWCDLLDLSPESGAGSLVWAAAGASESLDGMRAHVEGTDAPAVARRAATNHLDLAESWGMFAPGGLAAADLAGSEVTVLDVSGLASAPMNAVVRGAAEALYRARVRESIPRLPWLLVDEAHAFFRGVGRAALERILTRGRAPGVSLVLATQRPGALSEVAVSQADVLVAHRLTSRADLDALSAGRPTYLDAPLSEQLPTGTGEVLVVDDATETVHAATVRERETPHAGDSPAASCVDLPE